MCQNPIRLRNPQSAVELGWPLFREVPCGTCPECLRMRQNNWAERARRELVAFRPFYKPLSPSVDPKDTSLAFFFTFTYDNLRLPLSFKSGDYQPTLFYEHITDMFHHFNKKRFRQGKNALSYLLCGEYGTHTHRPHYHAIIIGLSIPEAREMREYWQTRHCPDSYKYDLLCRSRSYSEFYSSINFERTRKFIPDPLRCKYSQVGVTLSEIQLTETSINGCSRYVSKYIVKGGDDWYKDNSDLCHKPKICVTKGFGLGYRFTAPADKKSQDSAKLARLDNLRTSLFASLPCVPKFSKTGFYNPAWLQLISDRLRHTDQHGYVHCLPTFIYDYLIPKNYINGKSSFSSLSHNRPLKRRLYCAFPKTLQSTCISQNISLVDSLQLWRLAKLNERISTLFAAWKIQNPSVDSSCAFDLFYRAYELGERQKHEVRCSGLSRQFRDFYKKDSF